MTHFEFLEGRILRNNLMSDLSIMKGELGFTHYFNSRGLFIYSFTKEKVADTVQYLFFGLESLNGLLSCFNHTLNKKVQGFVIKPKTPEITITNVVDALKVRENETLFQERDIEAFITEISQNENEIHFRIKGEYIYPSSLDFLKRGNLDFKGRIQKKRKKFFVSLYTNQKNHFSMAEKIIGIIINAEKIGEIVYITSFDIKDIKVRNNLLKQLITSVQGNRTLRGVYKNAINKNQRSDHGGASYFDRVTSQKTQFDLLDIELCIETENDHHNEISGLGFVIEENSDFFFYLIEVQKKSMTLSLLDLRHLESEPENIDDIKRKGDRIFRFDDWVDQLTDNWIKINEIVLKELKTL